VLKKKKNNEEDLKKEGKENGLTHPEKGKKTFLHQRGYKWERGKGKQTTYEGGSDS